VAAVADPVSAGIAMRAASKASMNVFMTRLSLVERRQQAWSSAKRSLGQHIWSVVLFDN
jgi:hypothetical protein